MQIPQWYHFSCFFKKKILKAVNEVSGFGILRDEDQQKIRAKITGEESTDSPSSSSKKGRKTVITRSDLQVEYAKSNRSQCKSCSSRIEKVLLDEQSANTGLCELDWLFYVQLHIILGWPFWRNAWKILGLYFGEHDPLTNNNGDVYR